MVDDSEWDRTPTALEVAHYDSILTREANATTNIARKIFGTCLLQLTKLGVSEPQARSMLGKWRAKTKNDDLLVRSVQTAFDKSVPDPIPYITKALAGSAARTEKVTSRQKAVWQMIGWERPRRSMKGPCFKHGQRGQVWRDPFGKLKILPAPTDITIPDLDDDPGVDLEGNA